LFIFLSFTPGSGNALLQFDLLLACVAGTCLPIYNLLVNLNTTAHYFENNIHLSPETALAYDNRLDKLGLSNLYWVMGDEDVPTPSNKPIEPGSTGSSTSGTSSPGSSAAPEGNKTSSPGTSGESNKTPSTGTSGVPSGTPKPNSGRPGTWSNFFKNVGSKLVSAINETASKTEGVPKISTGAPAVALYGLFLLGTSYLTHKLEETQQATHHGNVLEENAARIQAELDKELQVEDRRHNNQLNEDATKIDKELQMEDRRHNNQLNEIEAETKAKKDLIDYKKVIIKPSGNLGGGNSSTASPETPESSITQKETSSIFSQAQKRTFFNDEINKTLFDDEINKGSKLADQIHNMLNHSQDFILVFGQGCF
jgi:hypothetical protein